MQDFFNPFSSTKAAKKMGFGSLSLTHTHTQLDLFPFFAIKDAWGHIEVNVWETILLRLGFFHDRFKVFYEYLS